VENALAAGAIAGAYPGDERRHVTQGFAAQPIGPHGESPPVVVRQPQTSPTELPAQNAILFDEIGQRLTLPAIQPARNGEKE